MGMSSVMVVGNSLLLQLEMQRDFALDRHHQHGSDVSTASNNFFGDNKMQSQNPFNGDGGVASRGMMGLASAARLPLGAVALDMDSQVAGRA